MRLFLAFILIPSFSFAQIFIGPLTEGEYFNEVVYEGVYNSLGNCTWADGTDFTFDFNGLTEVDGMEYVLIIDEPNPGSTFLMNGWQPVDVGDSTVFTPTTTGLGISAASGPAQLNFHVRLVGTPTIAGQNHPCWIDQVQTLALCDNTWGLFNGESLTPCLVQTSTGIEEFDNPFSVSSIGSQIKIESNVSGIITILQVDGKIIDQLKVLPGITMKSITSTSGLLILQLESEQGTFSKKILLQK